MSTDADNLSFLPDDYLARRARARANRLCGSLLIVGMLGVAGAFAAADRSLRTLKAEHAAVTEAFDREAERLQRLDALKKQQQSVARRARLAEAIIERTPRSELLGEVRDLLPKDVTLVEMTMTSAVRPPPPKTPEQILAEKRNPTAAPPPEPKAYNVGMRIGGVAYTDVQVAQFISRLATSRYFDDVNLLVSREMPYQGQQVRRFDVELTVRPEPLSNSSESTVVATEALPLR